MVGGEQASLEDKSLSQYCCSFPARVKSRLERVAAERLISDESKTLAGAGHTSRSF
jgi:hypothetical protein